MPMSYKTNRLINLLPDVLASEEPTTLLHKLLDAAGYELVQADDRIKALLKSHWVDYANGPALDGLGAIFGVERRRLPDGTPEPDESFRLRLKSTVSLFTGGGTRAAVLGAVRSALGLPFNMKQLQVPEALRQDLENLIVLNEFTPNPERFFDELTGPPPGELLLNVPVISVRTVYPTVVWRFTNGAGRRLRLRELSSSTGFGSLDELIVPTGAALRLTADESGVLGAFLDVTDEITNVTSFFQSTDGADNLTGSPARMPPVPEQVSNWRFTAFGALYDVSTFDSEDTFDRPLFSVDMNWLSFSPLTFEVLVPYFLDAEIERLKQLHNYDGEIFFFEGLDFDSIQTVVNQTKAAGVSGVVQFSLTFSEIHELAEQFALQGRFRFEEDADPLEQLSVRSGAQLSETHDVESRFALGGIFDVSVFDGDFGFNG